MKVEGKGGAIMGKVDKVINVFFFFEKEFNVREGILERVSIEQGGRHVEEGA